MKYIISYKIFEASQDEIDQILDKIGKSGMESLTDEEKKKLKNGVTDSSDDVSFDKDGNLLVNGKPPLYKNIEGDKPKSNPKEEIPKLNVNNLYSIIKAKYNTKSLVDLKNDDIYYIALDKNLENTSRVYYILFKKIKDTKSRISCLKLIYNLNSRNRNNFKIYDNYNNQIDFETLEGFLMDNGLKYGDFNSAWFYIEEDFINKSY